MVESNASDPSGEASPTAIGRSVAGGAAWASFGRIAAQAIQFLAGLLLARLLTPTEFGLFATVLIFTGLAGIVFELGLGGALIHAHEPTEQDFSTVFWVNAIGGVVLAVLLAALSPLLVAFFGEPELATLTPLAALTFTCNVSICQLAILQRSMDFRTLAKIELLSTVVSYLGGGAAAVAGWGAYSLVVVTVSFSAVNSILLWSKVKWRPQSFVSRRSLSRLWPFSSGLLGSNVIDHVGKNIDGILIARFVGTQPLGYYNRAYNLMSLPVQQVAVVMGRVMFPALVSLHDDRARIARGHRRAVRLINVFATPLLVGMAAASPALVPFLWGDQWGPVVPLLAILCVAAVPQCMTSSATWLYQSQGATRLMLRMDLLTSALGLMGMVVGLHWGALGVAWAILVREWVFSAPAFWVACRLVQSRAVLVLMDSAWTVLAAVTMGAAVWLAPQALSMTRESASALVVQVTIGVAVYGALTAIAQRDVLFELRSLTRRKGNSAA